MSKFDYGCKIIVEESNKAIKYKHEFILLEIPSNEDLNRIKAILTKRFSDYDTKIYCQTITIYNTIEDIVKKYSI